MVDNCIDVPREVQYLKIKQRKLDRFLSSDWITVFRTKILKYMPMGTPQQIPDMYATIAPH